MTNIDPTDTDLEAEPDWTRPPLTAGAIVTRVVIGLVVVILAVVMLGVAASLSGR